MKLRKKKKARLRSNIKLLKDRNISGLVPITCKICDLELKVAFLVKKAMVVLIYCPTGIKDHTTVRTHLRDAI